MSVTINIAVALSRSLAVVFMGFALAGAAQQEKQPEPFSRSEAAGIIANARRVVTPNGIERLEKVRIGGIDQWVSIRGRQ